MLHLGSCTMRKPVPIKQLLRNNLNNLDGVILFDETSCQNFASDFGHLVKHQPIAILKPNSAQDIVKVVRFANQHGLKVAMRGQGHSVFGQPLVEGGIVIDSSSLNSVQMIDFKGRPAVEAGAGALWGQVFDLTNTKKLTPPVNTDPTYLSVGGTLSTGGFGGTTWRDGFQADHVLELKIVTGDGRLLTCSEENNPQLFHSVLAGMGQYGLIVSATLELVHASSHVLFYVLNYTDLSNALDDLTFLVKTERFSHLDLRTSAGQNNKFIFNIEAGAFYDEPNVPNETLLLKDLKFIDKTLTNWSHAQYHHRRDEYKFTPTAHPWLHLCLPASKFLDYAKKIFSSPEEVAFAFPRFSIWKKSSLKCPLVRLPDEEFIARFQITRNPPESTDVEPLIAMNRTLYERAKSLGGTRITTTALPFSQTDWMEYYGELWGQLEKTKKLFDPNNVLNPGQGIFTDLSNKT